MKKILLFAVFACLFAAPAVAQKTDTAKKKKNKPYSEFVTLQINGLVHQILNFNGTTTTGNLNPYLVNYSINNNNTHWGFRCGGGFSQGSSSNITLYGNSSSSSTYFNFRAGVEKIRHLNKKFTAGLGFDLIYAYSTVSNSSNSNSPLTYDTSAQSSKTTSNSFGGGFMGWLMYKISPRIFVGTEASFYYSTGSRMESLSYTGYLYGQNYQTTVSPSKTEMFHNGYFTEPVVLYLVVRI